MPGIGFEWQFRADDLRMTAIEKTPTREEWNRVFLPSKSVIYRWDDLGVAIESDCGDVEFVSTAVTTWPELRAQLMLIGELLTMFGFKPDPEELWPSLRNDLKDAKMGLNFDPPEKKDGRPKRRLASTLKDIDYNIVLDGEKHILPQEKGVGGKVTLTKSPHGQKALVFRLPAPIKQTLDVKDGVETSQPPLKVAGEQIAVVCTCAGDIPPKGVGQCTVDKTLCDIRNIVNKFCDARREGQTITNEAAKWLKDTSNRTSNLVGFVTLLCYILEMFNQKEIAIDDDGPKAGFKALPRTNLRSLYRYALSKEEQAAFDAIKLPSEILNKLVCPHGYKAGTEKINNPLTIGDWLASIRKGDPGAGFPGLEVDFTGAGPRGPDYDALSPPWGYPAHSNPNRTSTWFTYSMGRENATAGDPKLLVEYRDLWPFGPRNDRLRWEEFVMTVAEVARDAGIANVPAPPP